MVGLALHRGVSLRCKACCETHGHTSLILIFTKGSLRTKMLKKNL
jgi:hypothetical protein